MKSFKISIGILIGIALLVPSLWGQVMKTASSSLDNIAFRDMRLGPRSLPVSIQMVYDTLSNRDGWEKFLAKYGNNWEIYIDLYSGMPAHANGPGVPWLPDGQALPLNKLRELATTFLQDNKEIFDNLPLDYLSLNPQRSGFLGDKNYLGLVDFDLVYHNIPIEGARMVFRINHGNLVQFGTEGVLPETLYNLDPEPTLSQEEAQSIVFDYAGGFNPKTDTLLEPGRLIFMPRVSILEPNTLGKYIDYPLIWEIVFLKAGETGRWTAHVDAHTGELLEFYDANVYGVVKGGVYRESPTVSSEAIIPLPFADIRNGSGSLLSYTDSGGNYSYTSGQTVKSYLQGKYVKINDNCGSISLSTTSPNDLNFGSSSGTDCTTPGYGGSGNTHASRSCFYHVSRIKEKGLSWLPSNSWLQGQLTANMNLNQTCNAYWNGSSINFFKSGGGCANTGEIAAIFLHEYGHGLDSNDGKSPADMSTGEAYGDTVAFLQTHNSCIGPGFLGSNCSGYGDSCTSCTGVRDVDYAKHSSGSPATTSNFVKNKCPSSYSYTGPCGKEGHCESYVLSQSTWDLANRDLPNLGYDAATSWFILDRLFYLSRSTSGQGYTCSSYTGSGCSTSNWHQTFLWVDDDDGNLSNGTPHAGAIKSAFNRHGIACSSSTSTNYSSCSSSLTGATPSLSATAGSGQVSLSWGAVSGASKYYILRNDFGCSQGYIKVGETTSTSYTDTAVAEGFTYYYRVVAVGSNSSCFSRLSACKSATPSGGGGGTTHSLSGKVTYNGSGLSGVNIALSGSASANTTTDTNGNYVFSGLNDGSYTVTPTKSGYTFTPSSQNVSISGSDVTGVNFTASQASSETTLTNGVPVDSSVAYHSWAYFKINVPSGATNLEFKTTNASADVDLYTRYGAKPTLSTYDCRPYTASGNETCTHANPSSGWWYAGVYGYASGSFTITATITTASATYKISGTVSGDTASGVTITLSGDASSSTTTNTSGYYEFTGLSNGSYTVTPSKTGYTFSPTSRSVTVNGADVANQNFTASAQTSGDVQLSNGVPYNDSMSATSRQGSWKYYYFTISSGDSNLQVQLSNLSNDLDLYVKQGAKPTLSSYDCRPYKGGTTTESCSFASPAAGTWWVGVNNWDTGSGMSYTVTASWSTGGGGDTTPPDTQMTSSQCGTTITTDSTTFTWTGTDNVTPTGSLVYSYRIDSGSWSSYTSATSKTYTGLSNGTHTFEVKAKDEAGNVDPTPASCSVTVNVSGDVQLSNGVPYDDSVSQGAWKYYYIDVPSGATNLEIKTTNASADVDLYTRYGAKPTFDTYDCRPYTYSGNETCTHSNPSAGTWWAGVYGYAAGSYTITATYTLGGSCSAQTATYNASFGAPYCGTAGSSCEATSTLLQCAGNDEPNYSNTIDGCADGTNGTCHSDESVESIKIETLDGSCIAPGKTVRATFYVYCYSSADYVKLYYSTSATSPSWTLLAGAQCTASGSAGWYYDFTLSGTAGTNQALRVQIVYNADPGSNACYSGSYNDRDDLVFKTSSTTLAYPGDDTSVKIINPGDLKPANP